MSDGDRVHAMFFAPSETGHMIPLLHIAEAVAKAGHGVTVCTSDFHEAKWRPQVEGLGGKFLPIGCGGITAEELERRERESSGAPFSGLYKLWWEPVRKLIAAADPKPRVIVADFCALAAQEAAEELHVELVINLPGSVTQLGTIDASAPTLGDFGRILQRQMRRGVVLVNSFCGLEPPRPLPPNVKMTGPVSPLPTELRQALEAEHAELNTWLRSSDAAVVLISTGSIAKLEPWQVHAVYGAVKLAKVRAVWSLGAEQQEALPKKDDPDFWIRDWIPQAALMQDEAVKLVVTHCGWGGTLECVMAAQPVICIPFFGDQFLNADLLLKSGCGEPICKPLPSATLARGNPYTQGMFTAEWLAGVLGWVLSKPKYKSRALALQRAARATGGADEAARQIEWAARFGVAHLLGAEEAGKQGGCVAM